ncbi:hypothetical protein C7R54_05685 [Achromobacter aloeverae]|uniref:Uncharacterized protein n=1 Tax=Achromobacter aloeverae TaxID=1750518 RepID=A0A4Q1HS76_9BURK|nr:hypothetical protein C7R54_05685 [Achromobacter aloeverae]
MKRRNPSTKPPSAHHRTPDLPRTGTGTWSRTWSWAPPDPTGPDRTGSDQDQTRPDQTGPDRTRPDQTGPDRTRPDQTGPDRSRRHGRASAPAHPGKCKRGPRPLLHPRAAVRAQACCRMNSAILGQII